MNYGEIKTTDIANGEGVRVSIFVSGCRNCCPGCFNRDTWAFNYGKPYTAQTQQEILTALQPEYISGLTILGGEPFEPENQPQLLELTEEIKKKYPKKTVWCFTGFTFEELLLDTCRANTPYTEKLLQNIDIIVDGKFVEEKKNISLQFRGSENQRIIDVKKTLVFGEAVIWDKLRR